MSICDHGSREIELMYGNDDSNNNDNNTVRIIMMVASIMLATASSGGDHPNDILEALPHTVHYPPPPAKKNIT